MGGWAIGGDREADDMASLQPLPVMFRILYLHVYPSREFHAHMSKD